MESRATSIQIVALPKQLHIMENMNMQNAPPPPPLGGGQMPPPIPQLPPQMFTTAAQLLDLTDSEHALRYRKSCTSPQERD